MERPALGIEPMKSALSLAVAVFACSVMGAAQASPENIETRVSDAYQRFVTDLRSENWTAVAKHIDTASHTGDAAKAMVDAYIAFAKEVGTNLPARHEAKIEKVEIASDKQRSIAFIRLVAADPVPEHMTKNFTALAFSRDGGTTWTMNAVDCEDGEYLRRFLPAWTGVPSLR